MAEICRSLFVWCSKTAGGYFPPAVPILVLASPEQQRYAPQTGDTDQRENNPGNDPRHPAKQRADQIILEQPDAAPVQASDNEQNERNSINPIHKKPGLSFHNFLKTLVAAGRAVPKKFSNPVCPLLSFFIRLWYNLFDYVAFGSLAGRLDRKE